MVTFSNTDSTTIEMKIPPALGTFRMVTFSNADSTTIEMKIPWRLPVAILTPAGQERQRVGWNRVEYVKYTDKYSAPH
jgi:hypothetical protein